MTLSAALAEGGVLHMRATVTHARRGAIRHAFRYGADLILLAPDRVRPPALMSRNRFNLLSWHDADHGGPRGAGRGVAWAREHLAQAGLDAGPDVVIALLTQPRFLGYWFNPVSFWMAIEGDRLIAVIAEVNNTFGQRHCYILARPGFAPIGPGDVLSARKIFHVSPFQDVAGEYRFNFALSEDRVAIRIRQIDGDEGLDAAMSGPLAPLTPASAVGALLRRPGGSLRIIALIHWHAIRLKLKGAVWRPLPPPPEKETSR